VDKKLSENEKEFLTDKMSIDLVHLEEKINSLELKGDKALVNYIISSFISSVNKCNGKQYISDTFERAVESIVFGGELYCFLDTLRHAFNSFVAGGLYDLYIYQEREQWYPKITLSSELKPNDIVKLPMFFDIYRGCDESELYNKQYGQSWSRSLDVAKEFAYTHYVSQSWYKKADRCILTTKIARNIVLFSMQSSHEKEIVPVIKKLINVQLIS